MPANLLRPSGAAPARPRARAWRGVAGWGWWLLLALGAAWGAVPGSAAAQERLVFRTIFQEREVRPGRELAAGQEVEVRDEFWRVKGALRLRVEGPDPDTLLVFRYETADPRTGALLLNVFLVSRRGMRDFQYREDSEIMVDGRIEPRAAFTLGEGVVTGLSGVRGEVAEIRIEDDAAAELRLVQHESELVLRLIPAREGGELSGRAYPIYRGERLSFLDYDVLGAGYTDNGYGELVLFKLLALKVNGFQESSSSAAAVRFVVREQLVRGRTLGLSLEGGTGYFTEDPTDPSQENEGLLTWSFGMTGQFRRGDWGISLHAATLNGPLLTMVMAGWQFSRHFSLLLEWQSLLGFSGYGLGLGIGF